MKLKLQRNGRVAAEMILRNCGDYDIDYLHVEHSYRGTGLATALLKKAQAKCGALVALVDPDNSPNALSRDQIVKWLLRHGFRHCWYEFESGNRKRALLWERNNSK